MSWWLRIALLVACAGCDDSMSCTFADCRDSFSILVNGPPAPDAGLTNERALPAGDYEIELALDRTSVLCRWSLPPEGPSECNDPGVQLDLAPSQLPERPISGLLVYTLRAPSVVSAIVRHQGSVLVQKDAFMPQYQTYAPNGEACGPVCKSASEVLTVSF